MVGTLEVAERVNLTFHHVGGSSTGGVTWLYVDGKELGAVGDDRSKDSNYDAALDPGSHEVRWKIVGGLIGGANRIEIIDKATGRKLPLKYTEAQEKAARTPATRMVADLAGGTVADTLPENAATAAKHRPAAEWVLSAGGEVVVEIDGSRVELQPGANFPAGVVKLLEIDLAARQQIKNGDLANIAGLSSVTKLTLYGCNQIADAGLFHLKGLTGLTSLNLLNTKVTDKGLAHLSGLTKLTFLDLSNTLVKGSGLEDLNAPDLDNAVLVGLSLQNSQLAHLSRFPKLTRLEIYRSNLDDVGTRHIAACTSIKVLSIGDTKVTAKGIESLASMTALEHANLWKTGATDASLASLSGLTNLKQLYLNETQVTDAGLKHLETLTNLESLNVDMTKVTPQGIAALKQKLPKLPR